VNILGILSIVSRIIVASGFGIYIYGMIRLILRNFHSQKRPEGERLKEHPLNLILLLLCLIFLLIISQIKLTFTFDGSLRQNVNIIIVSVFLGLGIVFLIAQITKKKKIPSADVIQHVLSSKQPDEFFISKRLLDWERKSNHIIAFGLALFAILIGGVITYILVRYWISHPEYSYFIEKWENFWFRNDGTTFLENIFNTEIFSTSRSILSLTFGGSTLLLLTIEYSRLSGKINFPFQEIVQRQLRWEEKNAIGSYIYLITGLAVSSVILSSILFLGVTSVVSFGDSAASIVGMRYGKHKYRHNNKTIEGTIAGSITSLISVFLFAGIYYAIAAVIVFIIIDLVCPNPFKINDNLLLPLVLTGTFVILFALKVPSMHILEYFL